MAVYPCELGNHRYAGAQKSAYFTFIDTGRPTTQKLRLCEKHYREIHQLAETALDLVDEDSDTEMSKTCQHANCAAEREVGIFLKLYPGGEGYTQFAGDFCRGHGDMVWLDLHGDMAKSL